MGRLLLDLIHVELIREFNELETLIEQFGFEAVRAAAEDVRQSRRVRERRNSGHRRALRPACRHGCLGRAMNVSVTLELSARTTN